MFKRIDHTEIVPSDFERTLNFYTEILGFKIQWRHKSKRRPSEEVALIELGDTLIEMFSAKNAAPASKEEWQVGYRRIALQVEDAGRALEYLRSKGVEIVGNPAATENLRQVIIKDPDGLPIELLQRG